jgi:cyclophilin family peptidyl-prolyl cis-trans isomerase
VRRALGAAWDHLSATDEVEGLQSWAKAVAALEGRSFVDRLGSLALHAAPPVRAAARDALRALGAEVPEGAVREVENPIAPSELIESSQAIAALLRTDRGEIEIELAADAAPTTVARFRSLAEAGYFDGLTFHRVVSAFVIQGGDPRGDGYGGPGWTQRCEDNRLPYRRGTVGMALAGRDTGGSQLFIAHGAQPHLEGRYTAFGRVVRGLDALDAIQRGDRILGVEITR